MAEPNWLRHGVRLGLVTARRTVRRIRHDQLRWRLLVASTLALLIGFGGVGVIAALSLRMRAETIGIPSAVRGGVIGLWVLGVWFVAKRTLLHWRHLRGKSFILTTVSTRTAGVGLFVSEFVLAACCLLAPMVLVLGIVLTAFKTPISLLLVPLAVGLFAASAIAVGHALGFGYLCWSRRRRAIALPKRRGSSHLVLLAITIGVVASIVSGTAAFWEALMLERVPIGWLVDLAVLGTSVESSTTRSVVAASGALVASAVGCLIGVRLAGTYWCTDGAADGTERESGRGSVGTPSTVVSSLLALSVRDQPTRRIAELTVRRCLRAPRRLLIASTPLVSVAVWIGIVVARTDHVWTVAPAACAVIAPWFAGTAFGLNPLGDDGRALPATLTATVSGRQFVRGHAIPGLLVGLPLAVVSVGVSSLVGPYSSVDRIVLVVVSGLLTGVAVVVAIAVGLRFPRFGTIAVGTDHDVAPPSLTAFTTYSALIGLLGSGSIGLLALSTAGAAAGPVDRWSILVAALGVGVVLAIVLALGVWSYRSAVRRFETYALP